VCIVNDSNLIRQHISDLISVEEIDALLKEAEG